MFQCGCCSLVFTNPRPFEKDLPSYYQSEDYLSHTESQNSLRDRLYVKVQSFMLKRKLKLIRHLNSKGRLLLDVGCGAGAFAKFMQVNGYQVVGVEPQPSARQKAREKGVQVFEKHDFVLDENQQSFDFITLWHVLEHQPRFLRSLEHYHRLLGNNGHLVIAVPQYLSYDARHYKNFWAAYDLPRHLYHFSRKTIVEAARKKGFKLVKQKGMPFDALYVSQLSEKYQGHSPAFIRGALVGLWSNFLAFLGIYPWSSQIFVFRKK